jgi:hypothetical protein
MFTVPLHSNGSYSIVAWVFLAAGMCLPSRCLAMNVYSDFIIPAFGHHVTIYKYFNMFPSNIRSEFKNLLRSPISSLVTAIKRKTTFRFRYPCFALHSIPFFFFFSFFPWCYSPNLGLCLPPWNSPFHFGFLDLRKSVGLLGRVISSSQGLSTCTQTQKNAHTY